MRPVHIPLVLSLGVAALGSHSAPALAQELAVGTFDTADKVQTPIDADREEALAQRDAYQRTITELEARVGIYGIELSEAYAGLGSALRTLDEHDAAAEAYGKALQALRVGYGLNDLRQIPVLKALRATHEQRGDWEQLHSTNYLIFNIAQRNHDEDLRVNSLLELGRWLRKAEGEGLVSDFDANPSDLLALYDSEIARLEAKDDYAGKNVQLASLYLESAATELAEAKRKYEMPITDFQTPGLGDQQTTTTQTCFSGVDRNGRPMTVCNAPVVLPNMNYYLGPNAQKSTEIRVHLVAVENTVMKAFHALQAETASPQHATLQAEMMRLTGEYNAFVEENRNQSTPLR